MPYKSNLIQHFSDRGYIHQATNIDALDALATNHIIPTYIGFDCTADSLHVGSLVQIMMLRILQKSGCLLYTSPSPRDQRGSRKPSSA